MSRSNAAALAIVDNPDSDQDEYQASTEPEGPQTASRRSRLQRPHREANREAKRKVPEHATLWGFVRRVEDGNLRNAKLMAQDTTLHYDQKRHRFLVSFDKLIMDDLSPLEFLRFIRQLCSVSSQVVFKLKTNISGVAVRARRVWS